MRDFLMSAINMNSTKYALLILLLQYYWYRLQHALLLNIYHICSLTIIFYANYLLNEMYISGSSSMHVGQYGQAYDDS